MNLLTIREKMIKHRGSYQSHLKWLAIFYNCEKGSIIFKSQQRMIQELNQKIKLIEAEMDKLIKKEY